MTKIRLFTHTHTSHFNQITLQQLSVKKKKGKWMCVYRDCEKKTKKKSNVENEFDFGWLAGLSGNYRILFFFVAPTNQPKKSVKEKKS